MPLQVEAQQQSSQPADERQQDPALQQPEGGLQHPRGPSASVSSDGGPRVVNGTAVAEPSSSSSSSSSATGRSFSTSTLQSRPGAAAAANEGAAAAAASKREAQQHRRKGNTWLDIFSFGRWRSSSNRQQGAIQLAQAFGVPNQPGRPGPVIGVFVCKGPRNELQGLVVASPLSLERFSFEGRLLQRAAPPQPLTCCRGGKIGGVGRVLLCGSQAGRVFIVNAETFDLMLELDTKSIACTAAAAAAALLLLLRLLVCCCCCCCHCSLGAFYSSCCCLMLLLPAAAGVTFAKPPAPAGGSAVEALPSLGAAGGAPSSASSKEEEGAPQGSAGGEGPAAAAAGAAAAVAAAAEEEVSICSLTINATFAEFAHFVLAGDARGRTFVWQVPSTKLLLVLPPPDIQQQQQQQQQVGGEEVPCCGCCAKLLAANDQPTTAQEHTPASDTEGTPHQQQQPQEQQQQQQQQQQQHGGVQAVGTVAEVCVREEDTDEEDGGPRGLGQQSNERQRDTLAPACDTPPAYQTAQWLGSRPRGSKKKSPAPRSNPPKPSQGDQHEQGPQGPDDGDDGSLFSGDDSGEETVAARFGGEAIKADGGALLQPDDSLPFIQPAPEELLQQLRAEAQQRRKQQQQQQQQAADAAAGLQPTGLSPQGSLGSEEACGSQAADGAPQNSKGAPSGSRGALNVRGGGKSSSDTLEDSGVLESIPLSPEACRAPANSPSAPLTEATPALQLASEQPFRLPFGAACASSNCCAANGRMPCGRAREKASSAVSGASRYVGAMLPLAALDQLWVGYGDGSLAVFSLSTYQLLHSTKLADPDISKIEYAKYRAVTCSSPLSFLYLLEAPEAWELRSTIILAGCMDGSICVRRLERDLADGGISCKLVRNYIREVEPQVPISCILVDSWLNAAFVGDASGVVFTLPYVFQLLEAPALANAVEAEA
ncbi:hypothetical protein Emag_004157 [Eimeria magna]